MGLVGRDWEDHRGCRSQLTLAALISIVLLADVADEDGCTFAPAINPDTERLLGAATNLPPTFAARQRHFEEAKERRLRELRAELVRAVIRLDRVI